MAIFLTVAGQAKCTCAASAGRGTLPGIDDPASRDLDGLQVAARQQRQSRPPLQAQQLRSAIFSQAQRPDGRARPVPIQDILPAPSWHHAK